MEKVITYWRIERYPYSKGGLIINEDKTFHFKENSHLSETFSNGNWEVKEDTLILNSNMPKECLYVNNFGPRCESNYGVFKEKIETTHDGCEPKDFEKFYTSFKNEKFIYRNDSLIYQNKNCSNKQDYYKIYR